MCCTDLYINIKKNPVFFNEVGNKLNKNKGLPHPIVTL